MTMRVKHQVGETYIAAGDGCATFPVPDGIETIEKISVDGRQLRPGTDYSVEFPRGKPFAPQTFTLTTAPDAGANIHVQGFVWEKGKPSKRR